MSNTNRNWALKHKVTGQVYPKFTYATREAARKAAQGRRFNGNFMVIKMGDGGINPSKLPKYPKPTKPKKAQIQTKEVVMSPCTKAKTPQSNGRPLNTTPQLRKSTQHGIGFAVHKRFL